MKKKLTLKNYVLASIITHIGLGLLLLFFSVRQSSLNEKAVEVVLVNPDELKKDATIDPEKDKAVQIVETDSKFANNQLNEQAKYNSEKNNTVDKETRAKTGAEFKNSLKHGSQSSQGQKSQKMQRQQKATALANLFKDDFDPYAALKKKTEAQEQKNLARAQNGAQAGEASTTNDNLSVQEDLITKLNTKEYKYYGYYHRIKLQLNQWWQPKVREKVTKMMSQGRTVASEENRTTRLIIILNDAGTLVKVQVLAESGVRDLDDAAVEAFRAAAPFPNPPKGIVEKDGTVKIRWDFVVES